LPLDSRYCRWLKELAISFCIPLRNWYSGSRTSILEKNMSDEYEVKFLMNRDGIHPAAQFLVHSPIGGMCRTDLFWSKEEGRKVIMIMAIRGQISDGEKHFLGYKLKLSSLPDTQKEAFALRRAQNKATAL